MHTCIRCSTTARAHQSYYVTNPSPPFLRLHLLRPRRHRALSLLILTRRRRQRLISDFFLDLFFVASLAEFVDSGGIDFVSVALVEVDEEDDVVAEGGEAVEGWHFDCKGEEVVDEGVEDFVGHGSGGHVGDTLLGKQGG